MAVPLVAASIEIYRQVSTSFQAVLATIHYSFNIKDIAKCFQGLCLADSETCVQQIQMLRLFYHETERVYSDRMSSKVDQQTCQRIIQESTTKQFETPIVAETEDVIFSGFINGSKVNNATSYTEIRDVTEMREILNQKLTEMNEGMLRIQNWTLAQESTVYLLRILRVLQLEAGNGVIVGGSKLKS